MTALLRVPGLGPKRVRILWHDLEIQTLEQLLQAAKDGRIRDLPGFGAKTEQKILDSVQAHLGEARRFKLSEAAQYAEALAAYLRKVQGVKQVEIAGSFRRMKETVGDLDMLAAAVKSSPVMARFARYEDVKEVLSSGPTRSTVILKNGIQVDLRVLPQESYGAALQYFTGSKAHNIVIRRMAQEQGLKINEYGVFRGEERIAGATEESVYAAVGLPWIPPELREDRGEIEAARDGKLPKLVELADLRGDLHAHSKASDGHNTIGEMAQAAKTHGLDYIAITDHSKRLTVAHGLDPARLRKQIAEIKKLNAELAGITVLAGIEVDILDEGGLDLPDAVLAELDVVVAAVHSRFDLPRAQQTARILKALDNPRVHILAHPSGRLLDERERLRRRHAASDPRGSRPPSGPGAERAPAAPRPHRYLLPDGEGRGRAGGDQLGRPQHLRARRAALRCGPGTPRLAGEEGRPEHPQPRGAARLAAALNIAPRREHGSLDPADRPARSAAMVLFLRSPAC